ncbi:tRNA (Cmo5U34)-methyltransferase [Vibrio chagasii]|uniref:methyltransferase domain-containing protein n=1 Tax=Vibrio crassostreae TaxID=246167 RepID=UPI00062F460E|nr:methyltransferase domain-containing protein [Vibrio crassostreae]CAH6804767.1 tRNA (Cmo5U34)-methyltransferase [Vibrio chagasii]TCN95780.1 tRNA (cmo5U34)-methyltransferase [Vibrio crassostreae]CAH6814938.1 tRNA (Cmo5U34)-methyltransferase [Vibrio chagasii]CAH6819528.1 tRNA (Cmo5U34)-methyltransferase [Vibrio chagasii]CAH6826788.1 tRNA (Cmo5U34)-methyltransferase [Vibrio chagasii]
MMIPKDWTFKSSDVAEGFDTHVREQLPWYNIASSMTAHFARNYLPENGVLLDLGCSTGNVSDSCRETITNRNVSVVNVDNSEEMAELFRGVGEVTIANIENFEIPEFDVCVMFLSMMFVPVNSRSALIMELMKNTRKGGLVLIVDKMESFSGYSGQVINRLSLVNKLDAGAKPDEVLAKELSLSGVQRPINPELLNSFTKWFQIGEFCGYLYEG